MNKISEQLLEAIDTITENKISKLDYDKTIKATIYSVVDADTGEYKVKYEGNIFSAFASDTSKTYKVDAGVYVSVPEGNFSNKKIIISTTSKSSLTSA
jgi:hypothetical protein